uniref:Uncharacterized protein n=1 Tax=Serratia proteamaculans (strain 568) TaxID=399741 RepID=A8GLN0_SERP5
MTWVLNNWRLGLVGLIVALLLVSWWSVSYYSDKATAAEERAGQLASDNTLQSETLATQAFQFNRMNEIGGAVQKYQIAAQAKSEGVQIEIRTIVKRDPAGRQCVDRSVAERLLNYKDSLRARAMPGFIAGTVKADPGTESTACRLTYGQAVYWIEPLMVTIDNLYAQIEGVQKADKDRQQRITP